MTFGSDHWRDTYDAWKLASPDDYYDEECFHEEYETDINGRATCFYCGESWWLTPADIERERELNANFDKAMRREERRQKVAAFVNRLMFWRKPALDDDIPF